VFNYVASLAENFSGMLLIWQHNTALKGVVVVNRSEGRNWRSRLHGSQY